MKNRGTAIIITILFGWLGFHKMYLGKALQGLLYFVFFWTLIPFFISLLDVIVLAAMNENEFHRRYNYYYFYYMHNVPEKYPEPQPILSNQQMKVVIVVLLTLLILVSIVNVIFWKTDWLDGTGFEGMEIFE